MAADKRTRCHWVGNDSLMIAYHDQEWGRPEHGSVALFEKLMLDGFQAGLSWRTILHRRQGMREALWHFDPAKLANLTDHQLQRLQKDPRLIRHPQKIQAIRKNAQAYQKSFGHQSFSQWLWNFAPSRPCSSPQAAEDVLTESQESHEMSKSLRKLGFSFCGPTICYAFMQAVGMVNDHTSNCFLIRKQVRK